MRLNPKEQVRMEFLPQSDDKDMGEIDCFIEGLWRECIMYEVPIMSISVYVRFMAESLRLMMNS